MKRTGTRAETVMAINGLSCSSAARVRNAGPLDSFPQIHGEFIESRHGQILHYNSASGARSIRHAIIQSLNTVEAGVLDDNPAGLS